MKHPRSLATVASLAAIAVAGVVTSNEPIAYIATGALAGYLGKVNGGK
jgi:hypothetical protein